MFYGAPRHVLDTDFWSIVGRQLLPGRHPLAVSNMGWLSRGRPLRAAARSGPFGRWGGLALASAALGLGSVWTSDQLGGGIAVATLVVEPSADFPANLVDFWPCGVAALLAVATRRSAADSRVWKDVVVVVALVLAWQVVGILCALAFFGRGN